MQVRADEAHALSLAPPPAAAPDSQWLALRWMAASRLAVALALAMLLSLEAIRPGPEWFTDPRLFAWASGLYLAAALVYLVAIGPLRPRFQPQLVAHVLTDLAALVAMLHAAGGLRAGFGVLVVAAVTAGAVLSTRRMAAFFAAAASLMLLGESVLAWLTSDGGQSVLPMMAGLTGAACFVTAMLVNWLATQLRRQEEIARERGEDLRNQFAVTQRVVAELEQGVLVIAPDGRVRAMNPAARELLGAAQAADADDLPGLATVARACAQWREAGGRTGERRELLLPARHGADGRVMLRFIATPGGDSVLMLEDLRRAEERAQQLKLAAMGRLSASIAHEIRNPLGAIRHANALLAERLGSAAEKRLAGIIEDNTVRIDRVITDVLSVSRRERPGDETVDMRPFLSAFAEEFTGQAGLPRDRVSIELASERPMRFDSNHLRQVLVNLVGNALRYASGEPGSVRVSWRERGPHRLELRVSDDGPGLSPEMQQQAFEPFFTTEARGTGLGLYLTRELCVANGATIRYEPPFGDRRGAFVVEPRVEDA
ncbi:ATP-binding protein [Burkholderiaceae bacterium FT117]|uniref:sensor histidine kinase n=1 Tax=Zeimonas sediminis TaxID=2944268 RepID=UPI002342E181|nr:ATP-binding protein [Zeimonas sediminis]MCM5570699.1 ATP-binding protein [Zeimonas sediminis]